MSESLFLNDYYRKTYNQRLKYLKANFEWKNKKVLELAGGVGYISNELSKEGAICTVVEARNINLETGMRLYPELKFIKYDLECFFDFGKFDYVLNFGLIYHMKNFKQCIANSIDSLADGGILMIDSNVLELDQIVTREKREKIENLDQAYIDEPVYDFSYRVIEQCLNGWKYERIKEGLIDPNSPHNYSNGRAFYVMYH